MNIIFFPKINVLWLSRNTHYCAMADKQQVGKLDKHTVNLYASSMVGEI